MFDILLKLLTITLLFYRIIPVVSCKKIIRTLNGKITPLGPLKIIFHRGHMVQKSCDGGVLVCQ